jgi:hypothetical protein
LIPSSLNLDFVTLVPPSYQEYFNALDDINIHW